MRLGRIDRLRRTKSPEWTCENFLHVLTSDDDVARSYQALLTSLHVIGATRPLRTLLVTSIRPQEGKTTVSINLALTMMLAGKNVLVVDTDWRRPRLHRILGLEATPGFADVLAGTLTAQDVIQVVKLPHEGPGAEHALSAITSGKLSPTSFSALAPVALGDTIHYLVGRYGVVLFDSPPTLAVSDPLVVAGAVDGVILVMHPGLVGESEAKRAKKLLEQAGAKILGVVMNRFDERANGPGLHPYHSYYADLSRGAS